MKVVETAHVEVVRPHELKVGDHILWSDHDLEIKDLSGLKILRLQDRKIVTINHSLDGEEQEIKWYRRFYKMTHIVHKNICIECGQKIIEGDICGRCKREQDDLIMEDMVV